MAHVEYEGESTILSVKEMDGDQSAWLFVNDQQILQSEVIIGLQGEMVTKFNIETSANSTFHVPLELIVDGTTLTLAGIVTFKNIVLEKGGILNIKSTSHTASYSQNKYEATTSPGTYLLTSMKLKHGSQFNVEKGLSLLGNIFDIKRNVIIEADFMKIIVKLLSLERGSELSASGRAPIGQPGDGEGNNGGAYASSGGVLDGEPQDNAYGTLYTPRISGSQGGQGGKGGAYIRIDVEELFLDGIIRADGAYSYSGGGGSGGSLYITCSKLMHGLGELSANGGSTSNTGGGGGSGGRVAVYAIKNSFLGSYSATGGAHNNLTITSPKDGGPGSVYIQEGKQTDQTLREKLIVDNRIGQLHNYLTIAENNLDITLDNVEMYNFAKLQLIEDGQPRRLEVRKVDSDGTGLLRMRSNHFGTLERFNAGGYASSKLRINLELHNGGEFVLSETTFIMGKAPTALDLNGVLRGVLNMYITQGRRMRMGSNAKIVPLKETALSRQANITFSLFQLDPGSIVEVDPNTGVNMLVGEMHIKFRAKFMSDFVKLNCTSLSIEIGAELACSGDARLNSILGTSALNVTDGGGAGHAGIGGDVSGHTGSGGLPHGSLYRPVLPGSQGSGANRNGGGLIILQIGNDLFHDGEVSVNAQIKGTGGGGSGGSILTQVKTIRGIGKFTSNGGDGHEGSGGGSAGRIAVYSSTPMILFFGDFVAYGGNGHTTAAYGAGGTVYLEDVRAFLPYNILRVDNNNNPWQSYTYVDDNGHSKYEFHELHLYQKAYLRFGSEVTVESAKVVGDGSGLLHATSDQVFVMEYREATINSFTSAINFIIDEDAEIIFPATVFIYGTGATLDHTIGLSSITLNGRLTGVAIMVLSEGKSLHIGDEAHTAGYSNKTYTYIDQAGLISMGLLQLRSSSSVICAPDNKLTLNTGRIDIGYNTRVLAESIHIQTGTLNIEAGGQLTTAPIDRPDDLLDAVYGSGTLGSGAGHASRGGNGPQSEGGSYYGSLYQPRLRGSQGGDDGDNKAGKGGGVIYLSVAFVLLLDGDVIVDGGNGHVLAGGGSAGSILVECLAMEGHGVLSALGGTGRAGGSGGRIAVHLGSENHFAGKYISLGGSGASAGLSDGGPGTVYLNYLRSGRPYTKLLLDNSDHSWDQYHTLNETDIDSFHFNELHLLRGASLDMKQGQPSNITIRKLHGDRTGRLHLHAGHVGFIEKAETVSTTTKTPANVWIDEGAKAFMATLVYILGIGEVAFRWNGEIIGVQHLRIVPGRNIEVGSLARTSSFVDEIYQQRDPLDLSFSSFELGAESLMPFPTMGMKLTVAHLVSRIYSCPFFYHFF